MNFLTSPVTQHPGSKPKHLSLLFPSFASMPSHVERMACGETGSPELEKKEPAATHMTNWENKKTKNPQIQAKPHRHLPSSRVGSDAKGEVIR